MIRLELPAIVLLACALWPAAAGAHKESDAYLTLRTDPAQANVLHGQWDIALRDLAFVIDVDRNRDGAVTWGEVKAQRDVIERYALARLVVRSDGRACQTRPTGQMIDEHTDGAYDVVLFDAVCEQEIPSRVTVDYHLFDDVDPYHRGIVTLRAGDRTAAAVLGPDAPTAALDLQQLARWHQARSFAVNGVWHIWTGPDHLLFIFSLLLPAVLLRRRGAPAWTPVPRLRSSMWELVKVVSAFTVAHSATLTLSVLGYVHLPSRLVESGIALSVIVAALNNLYPVVTSRAWLLAFAFGLIHGLGFASVLAGLDLPAGAMAAALSGFSLGVEIGQEAIVLPFVTLAFLVRRTRFYQVGVLRFGSVAIMGIASVWLVQRAFDVVIPGTGFLTPA